MDRGIHRDLEGAWSLSLVDREGDALILTPPDPEALEFGRPVPRLEATLGAVEGDECADLDIAAVEALRDFLDEWLAEVSS